jgi:hypothetical protein
MDKSSLVPSYSALYLMIDLLNDDEQIREIKEAQAGLPGAEGVEVLIGGTTFLSPSDMRDLLFGSHCLP